MCDNKAIVDSVCITRCPPRWCCSVKHFSPPPLCREEIRAIRSTGATRFFDRDGAERSLKIRSNGYCIFFGDDSKTCTVYAVRPFDCRIFPFDFFSPDGREAYWVLWDCPYARRMEAAEIERRLNRFEVVYARHIAETWAYGMADYTERIHRSAPITFRVLRKMKRLPSRPFHPDVAL